MRLAGRARAIAGWALSSLSFHRTRSFLTVVALGLATALLIATLGFATGYKRSVARDIAAMGYQILVTGKGCPHEAATLILRGGTIPMYLQEEVYARILAQPEVGDATRFLMQSVADASDASRQIYVGIDGRFLALKPDAKFQRGGWFSSDTAAEAILGYNVAEYRRLGLGDRIRVQGEEVSVRGVLDRLGSQDDGMIFLPLGRAQILFEKRDRLTGIGVRLKELDAAGTLIDRLYEWPSVQVVRLAQVQATLLTTLAGIRALLLGFAGLCLFIALVGVFNVALITASERTAEMGVLRALGCPRATLFGLVWSESLLQALGGVGFGIVLASVLSRSAARLATAWLSFVPPATDVALTPGGVALSGLLVVVLCLGAAALPAWKSSVVAPSRVIRGAP